MQNIDLNSLFDEALDFYASRNEAATDPLFDLKNSYDQVLNNITLSDEQFRLSKLVTDQLFIRGSAGSGKSLTLVARLLKRMAEYQEKRFLFVSFNKELVRDAEYRYRSSPSNGFVQKFKHKVVFTTYHGLACYCLNEIGVNVPAFGTSHQNLNKNDDRMKGRMLNLLIRLSEGEFGDYPALKTILKREDTDFLMEEFSWMKGNGFIDYDSYMTCERKGRGRLPRVSVEQRKTVFKLFQEYLKIQEEDFKNRIDKDDYALLMMENLQEIRYAGGFDFVFIDEMQDFQPMQLKSILSLCEEELVMSGDDKQRVHKSSPFSYRDLGLDINNSNNVFLKDNFRSTYQIMKLANSLNFSKSEDDKKYENAKFFKRVGKKPVIYASKDRERMLGKIRTKIDEILKNDKNATIGILHRYNNGNNVQRTITYLSKYRRVQRKVDGHVKEGGVYFLETKNAKGLEFDYVFILDFSVEFYPHVEETNPLRKKKQPTTSFQEDWEDMIQKEKRVLYVGLTRAKKEVELHYCYSKSAEKEISSFARDFAQKDYDAHGFRKTYLK